MNLQHKNLDFELKLDAPKRIISGYASTFGNVDKVQDIVLAGAFMESLQKRTPKMLYQHERDDLCGKWNIAREDGKGLYVEGYIAKTELGNEVLELASIGALDSMSIGYSIVDSEYRSDGIRLIKKVDLYEVSFVTFPANDMATISGVKNMPDNIRDFEKFLREAGYSRKDAVSIASHGFKALTNGKRDSVQLDDDVKSAAGLLADFLKQFNLQDFNNGKQPNKTD